MELLHSQYLVAFSTDDQVFEHKRLDHTKLSIRLVRILPSLSSTGLIQCTISHHDVHASYNCLSYCWGSPTQPHRILVNGMAFWVRQNLFDFLSVVQNSLSGQPSAFYWIDAICIDQDHILERNHQVAQMSQIFSEAKYVHLWLGKISSLRTVLHFFLDSEVENNPSAWKMLLPFNNIISECITHNEYWERAWVVQELALARLVLVILPDGTIALPHLLTGLQNLYLDGGNPFFTQFTAMINGNNPEKKDILSLISHFRNQKCSVPRDRVFSLLSLCDEGPENFTVDYGESIANVALDVLSKARGLPCFCSIVTLLYALRLQDEKEQEASVTLHEAIGPYLEFDCVGLAIEAHYTQHREGVLGTQLGGLSRIEVAWHDDACHGHNLGNRNEKWEAPALSINCSKMVTHSERSRDVTVSVFESQDMIRRSDLQKRTINKWTNYIHAPGFSARRKDGNKDVFTIRVAFWALASWGRTFDPSPNELCSRARLAKHDYHKYMEKRISGFHLGVHVGYGSWDLKADEVDK